MKSNAVTGTALTGVIPSAITKLPTLDIPYRRYIDEVIHFHTTLHYAPVELDIKLPFASTAA